MRPGREGPTMPTCGWWSGSSVRRFNEAGREGPGVAIASAIVVMVSKLQ